MSRENDKNREQCHQNHKPLIRDRNMQMIYVLWRPLLILLGERDPLQIINFTLFGPPLALVGLPSSFFHFILLHYVRPL